MTGRGLPVTSRLVFFLCGLVSLVTAVPFAMLRGIGLPYQSEWVLFVLALGTVGMVAIALAVVRRSWIGSFCKTEGDARIYSTSLKLGGWFASIAYIVAVFAYFSPQSWNLNSQIMLAACPLYLVRMTFDPSAPLVFLLLAPMNAMAYASLGITLGFARLALRARVKT